MSEALDGEATLDDIARAISSAYDEVQRQLPIAATRVSPSWVQELVDDSIAFAADLSVKNVELQHPAALEHDDAVAAVHRDDVRAAVGPALDQLRVLRCVAFEEGRDFHTAYNQPTARHEVLTRLHARAITVADEAIALLGAGLASGAMARWRTLHELAVVASAIRDEHTAGRYLAHSAVTRYKRALVYIEHAAALGETPLTSEQFREVKAERDRVCAHYGGNFGLDYGWADHLVTGRSDFRSLERQMDQSYLRPYYQHASSPVHSDAHGVLLEVADHDPRALIVGPIAQSLVDPLQLVALSLKTVTTEVLLSNDDAGVRGVLAVEVLDRLHGRLITTLQTLHDELEPNAIPPGPAPADADDRPLSAWPKLPPEDIRRLQRLASTRVPRWLARLVLRAPTAGLRTWTRPPRRRPLREATARAAAASPTSGSTPSAHRSFRSCVVTAFFAGRLRLRRLHVADDESRSPPKACLED